MNSAMRLAWTQVRTAATLIASAICSTTCVIEVEGRGFFLLEENVQAAVLLSIGGVLGTLSRYYLGLLIVQRIGTAFPFGTLFINVTGCLLLGLVGGLAAEHGSVVTPQVRLLIGVGFCGAYTTFSTFGYETMLLLKSGSYVQAFTYLALSNVLGLAAVLVGYFLARMVSS